MAIDYTPVGWDTSKYVNPTNMNHMDDGIKAACDVVDALDEDLSEVSTRTLLGVSLAGITSYPNKVGVYRVVTNYDMTFPGSFSGYGILTIKGVGYYEHTLLDVVTLRTYTAATENSISNPTEWNKSLLLSDFASKTTTISFENEYITLATNVSNSYTEKGGWCFVRINFTSNDTSSHEIGYSLPKPAMPNYSYFYSSNRTGELRIAANGSIRLRVFEVGASVLLAFSYPIAD